MILVNRDVILAQLFFWRGMYNVNAFTAYQRSTGLTLNVGKHPRALAHYTGGIPFRTRAAAARHWTTGGTAYSPAADPSFVAVLSCNEPLLLIFPQNWVFGRDYSELATENTRKGWL